MAPPFRLIYHAQIPGRAEFIRLFFEATRTPYEDEARTIGQACIFPFLKDGFEGSDKNPTPFAPPILQYGEVVISQTPNIILYLSAHLPELDLDLKYKKQRPSSASLTDPTTFHRQALLLTLLDLANEVHDTHHPISIGQYYEEQKEAAVARSKGFREERVPKYFTHFEATLAKADSGYLLKECSYADLALFQIVDGLLYAFPVLMKKLRPTFPKIFALHARVADSPLIAEYLTSDRRQKYSMGLFRAYPELDGAE